MFSCKSGERAFETPKLGKGHGVFFYHVVEGLKGKAKNGRGDVTWARLTEYVVDAVSDVCSIAKDDLKPTPDLGGGSGACVSGLATVAEKMVMLLDIDALVASCIEADAPASSAA